jgi:hypothetical protein
MKTHTVTHKPEEVSVELARVVIYPHADIDGVVEVEIKYTSSTMGEHRSHVPAGLTALADVLGISRAALLAGLAQLSGVLNAGEAEAFGAAEEVRRAALKSQLDARVELARVEKEAEEKRRAEHEAAAAKLAADKAEARRRELEDEAAAAAKNK